MELNILLELLRLVLIGFEVCRYFLVREREKALIQAVEKQNQCPNQCENELRKP